MHAFFALNYSKAYDAHGLHKYPTVRCFAYFRVNSRCTGSYDVILFVGPNPQPFQFSRCRNERHISHLPIHLLRMIIALAYFSCVVCYPPLLNPASQWASVLIAASTLPTHASFTGIRSRTRRSWLTLATYASVVFIAKTIFFSIG